MDTAIDNFLMEIEEDLKNFRNGDAVRTTGRAENFLLDHADEIKKKVRRFSILLLMFKQNLLN